MASADKVISSVSLGRRQVSNIDLTRSQKLEEAYSSVATGLGNAEQHKIIAHTSGRTLSADTSAQSHQRTFIACSAAMGIEPIANSLSPVESVGLTLLEDFIWAQKKGILRPSCAQIYPSPKIFVTQVLVIVLIFSFGPVKQLLGTVPHFYLFRVAPCSLKN
jgi:hypothetical protein